MPGKSQGVAFVLTAALVIGCSSGSDASPSEVTLDASVVKTQGSALSTAAAAAASNDGATIAENIASIGIAASAIVPNTRSASRSQTSRRVSALTTSTTCRCATAASKTCSFDGCTIGGATVTGAVSWGSGKLTCTNLVFDVPAIGAAQIQGESVTIGATHVEVTCDVNYTQSSFDGAIRATGSTEVNSVAYQWDTSLTAANVTFSSSSRTFTGGSIGVDATITATSEARGAETFHASGDVAFP